jgi:BirA family biotin operon repressor/biotin-[acetyl-CoA-carboxylase] ligase
LEGSKFVRQLPLDRYVADFACRSAKLVIELDGGHHAGSATDTERTAAIEAAGYTVLRFRNHDVLANIEGVLLEITKTLRLVRNP